MSGRGDPAGRPVGGGRRRWADDVAWLLGELASPAPDDRWLLAVPGGDVKRAASDESRLCLADGVLGTRGHLEEAGAEARPAIYAGGVFERNPDGTEAPIAVPGWVELPLRQVIAVGDRVLDLRTGVVGRLVVSDGSVMLRSARWACLARPGTKVLIADGEAVLPETLIMHETIDERSSLGGGVRAQIDTTGTRERGTGNRGGVVLRVAAYAASPRRPPSLVRTQRQLSAAWESGPIELLAEQRSAWAARWEESDLEVANDAELTLAARFALFHLATTASEHGEGPVGPRGLTGAGYFGHVLWDADAFVLPVLAATHPASARSMLEYRIRRLPAARRLAAASGRAGARFPWESASDGTDVTPATGVGADGVRVPILTGDLEEHITADVAWAAWQLASWQGSWGLLEGPAGRLVVDTAAYWASRIRVDDSGRGHIDGVIGPDEYHESVDDDAFTNQMAAWNLRRAAELVRRGTGDAAPADPGHWVALADALVDGFDPVLGRHTQFVGYEQLESILVDEVGEAPMLADIVLGRQRLFGSQVVKQADVLMAHHMIPDALRPGTLDRDLDYYLPRTAHGSSLSPGVHASVLARAGRLDEAQRFLRMAIGFDLGDGDASEGLHMAALATLWHALVLGFAGVQVRSPDDRALVLDPHIPDDWGELRLALRWHGRALHLRCTPDGVHVDGGGPLTVRVASGEPVRLGRAGGWVPIA